MPAGWASGCPHGSGIGLLVDDLEDVAAAALISVIRTRRTKPAMSRIASRIHPAGNAPCWLTDPIGNSDIHMKEPRQSFGHDQCAEHPKDGLFLFGPVASGQNPARMDVGVIATPAGLK